MPGLFQIIFPIKGIRKNPRICVCEKNQYCVQSVTNSYDTSETHIQKGLRVALCKNILQYFVIKKAASSIMNSQVYAKE